MAELLKNIYNEQYIQNLAEKIALEYKQFDEKSFINSVFCNEWKDYELKQRMRHIAISLNQFLPNNYEKSIEILKKTAHNFSGMEAMYFQDFVELYGMDEWEVSMNALEHFTKYSSSEFAIRRFIIKDEDRAMKQMLVWAKSTNNHVRRLASEGCRSRLPWAVALISFKKNPAKVLEVLEILKNDNEKYVQKSVANNLNDISKDNVEVVINFLKNNINKTDNTNWILKHGSRTLLKQSNTEVLKVFGFIERDDMKLCNFLLSKNISKNNNLEFSFKLESNNPLGKLRVEYKIHFLRQNNRYNEKVFMISETVIKEKTKEFKKQYSFKPINTRKYYQGIQKLEIIVNGCSCIQKEFILN